MRERGRTRRALVIVLAVAATVTLVAACSCSNDSVTTTPVAPGTSTATTEPDTSTPQVPTYPLRGTVIDDAAKATRPALVVKIDNIDQYSRPQAGINNADIVFEEKIEGPISRFASVFHSTDADDLGPVRSGRSTDVAIVSALNRPLYAFSGANAVFIAQLRAAPLIDIGYDVQPNSYDRRKGRPAPDDVFTSTARLWALTPEGAGPPLPQFLYRTPDAAYPTGAVEVATFGYDFGTGPVGQPVTFTWDAAAHGWARTQKGTPHVDAAGAVITPTNVIVQFTPYHDTGMYDLSNTAVPEADLVGTGEAWVFIGGRGVKATWSKSDVAAITTYVASDGVQIDVDPGQTWIALVPTGGNFAATRPDGTPLVP